MPLQEAMYFESGDMEFTEKDKKYITEKVNGILERCPEIDEQLSARMRGWILRLGVYEILWDDEVPDGVAISEAVELAKKFGAENSGSFVNGVLAAFARKD